MKRINDLMAHWQSQLAFAALDIALVCWLCTL